MSPPPIYYGAQRVAPSGISKAYYGSTEVYSGEEPTPSEYLWFSAAEAFTVKLAKVNSFPWTGYYSYDGVSWTAASTAAINVPANTRIYWKMALSSKTNTVYCTFVLSGNNVHVGGKIASMVGNAYTGNYALFRLFTGATSITDASELSFDGLTFAGNYWLYSCFSKCTNLKIPPLIGEGATASNAYASMFLDCSNLKITTDSTVQGATYFFTPKTSNCTNMFKNTYDTSLSTPVVDTPYYYYQ